MKNHYFTFGQSDVDNDGNPLKDYWVRVVASSYGKARELFIVQFATHNLPRLSQWAFQYDDSGFTPEYFPKGELTVIREER